MAMEPKNSLGAFVELHPGGCQKRPQRERWEHQAEDKLAQELRREDLVKADSRAGDQERDFPGV